MFARQQVRNGAVAKQVVRNRANSIGEERLSGAKFVPLAQRQLIQSARLQRIVGNQALKDVSALFENLSSSEAKQHKFQPDAVSIQRQEHNHTSQTVIPTDLLRPIDVTSLSDRQLQDRYDRISRILSQLDAASAHKRQLQQEAGRIGTELGRRSALAAGRTFSPEAIERMRNYFITNASLTNPASCIVALNAGVQTLLNRPTQRVGSDIQTTMARLQTAGRAGRSQVIEFNDAQNRLTRGVRRPHQLRASVWDMVIAMVGGDPGWSVFGLSLMDGYHSVTLSLDNRNPAHPRIFWSDQWSSRGGWEQFSRATLDAEVTSLTQTWWDDELKDTKRRLRTRVTLWRLHQ